MNDTIQGLSTFRDEKNEVHMAYSPNNQDRIVDINFTSAAKFVLSLFGIEEEKKVDKYAVEDVAAMQRDELKIVRADINTIESNDGLTKEASARLSELKRRERELSFEV